jgi:large subunit ribosomal protein L31
LNVEPSLSLSAERFWKEPGMKTTIHPKYVDCTITCACGEVVHTRSTRDQIRVEVCSKCHPFFTGKQQLLEPAGRDEKLHKYYGLEQSSQRN